MRKPTPQIPLLRLSQDPDTLDPWGFVSPADWKFFTKTYTQAVRIHILQAFPTLDLVVEIKPPGKRRDSLQCPCPRPDTCPHQEAMDWLFRDQNWLECYEYAIRKLHRSPTTPAATQKSLFQR